MANQGKGDLADTLRFMGRGFLLAIASALVCGFAAYVVSSRLPPTYTATSTVFATDRPPDSYSLGLVLYRVAPLDADGYGFAATSGDVLRVALQDMNPEAATAQALDRLAKQIRISTDATSNAAFIHISAVSSSPESAAATANSVAMALIAWDNARSRAALQRAVATILAQVQEFAVEAEVLASRSDSESARALQENIALRVQRSNDLAMLRVLIQQDTGALSLFERAEPPLTSSGPRVVLNIVLALALGLVFGYAIVAVLEALHLGGRVREKPLVRGSRF